MSLKLTAQEVDELMQRVNGDKPIVCHLENDCAHILFYFVEEESCFVLKVDADERWMSDLLARRPGSMIWARSDAAFIETALTLWPKDDCVQRLATLFESKGSA